MYIEIFFSPHVFLTFSGLTDTDFLRDESPFCDSRRDAAIIFQFFISTHSEGKPPRQKGSLKTGSFVDGFCWGPCLTQQTSRYDDDDDDDDDDHDDEDDDDDDNDDDEDDGDDP